ncbi:hypothetical protein EIP86_000472 [Pleurotus ostreatoroseus]|nr:hypothetical protein EIP86_000472 [Pleurotus ostreatoroseus]
MCIRLASEIHTEARHHDRDILLEQTLTWRQQTLMYLDHRIRRRTTDTKMIAIADGNGKGESVIMHHPHFVAKLVTGGVVIEIGTAVGMMNDLVGTIVNGETVLLGSVHRHGQGLAKMIEGPFVTVLFHRHLSEPGCPVRPSRLLGGWFKREVGVSTKISTCVSSPPSTISCSAIRQSSIVTSFISP